MPAAAGTREVSPYDRLQWSSAQLEQFLASGAHRRELGAYFGARAYVELAALARRLRRQPVTSSRQRVYLLPGILGSQLGAPRPAPLPADLVWIDPLDIIAGELQALRLPPADAALGTMGVIAYSYLPLKLRLNAAGLDVRLCDYDWRQDIGALGARLAADLAHDEAESIDIVAHSLGGLVARVALARQPQRVRRLITLGTPHLGSWAALQALRGSYPVVRRLAALDLRHDAEWLAREVFGTFPSLYQMLPVNAEGGTTAVPAWPAGGIPPRPQLLHDAQALRAQLAPLDARCLCIAGIGEPTVASVESNAEEFIYRIERCGDGTVPEWSAVPEGARGLYLRCEHGELPRDLRVARACIDVLQRGETRRLARHRPARPRARLQIGDAQLGDAFPARVHWNELDADARQRWFNQLNLPPAQYAQLPDGRRTARRRAR